jgi:hypothetical protein
MIIIQDFREKHGHHEGITNYCKENNILLYRMKLEVGDYMLGTFENGKYIPIGNRSIDTKQDLAELATDLYKDKIAFNKKYRKCYDNKIQLFVLVEQDIKTLRDIVTWSSPHTRVNGRLLLDMIDRLRKSYGVKFVFCPKNQTALNIIKILTEDKE